MARLPSDISIDSRGFPIMETTPYKEKQTPKYNFQVLQVISSKYKDNKTEIGAVDADYLQVLYDYARGKQDVEQYNPANAHNSGHVNDTTSSVDRFVDRSHAAQKKGWYNINLVDVVSFLPNIMTQIKGKLIDVDYDIVANVIDKDSGAEEEWLMHKEFIQIKLGKVFDSLYELAGFPVQQKEQIAQDFQDLEQMKLDGKFKSPYISQVEKLLKHTADLSMWDRKLVSKYVDDLCVTGYAFGYPEHNKETNKLEWKYVNPKEAVMQYSEETDFDDADYGGVYSYPKISQIRALKDFIKKSDGSPITDEDLEQLAKDYRGYSNNPAPDNDEWRRDWVGIDNYYKHDDFVVVVLKGWWIDVEKEKKLEYQKKNGSKRFYPYDETVKSLGKREKVKQVRRRVLYHGKWIVGTDWVYDYGIMPNQPVMASNKPILPLKGVRLHETSLVHRLKPLADQYMAAWTRLQNYLANAAMEGYAIDVSKLANISDGRNKKYDMLDLVKLYKRSGWFFYKSNMNGYQTGGTPVPISNLPSNLGSSMVNEIGIMDAIMRKVEELTGVSPVALGASPGAKQAVGITEMSLNSFLDSLKVIIDGYRDLKEGLAQVTSKMLTILIKVDDDVRDAYESVIGAEGVQYFITSTKFNQELGISLRARPTKEDWNVLIDIAKASLEKRNQGIAGINESQFYEIYHAKNTGQSLTELFYKMKYWIRKDEQRLQAEKDRAIQLQQQGQQQVVMTQQEEQRKTLQLEMQKIMQEYEAQMISKNKQREVDSYYAIQEIKAEYDGKRMLSRSEQDS